MKINFATLKNLAAAGVTIESAVTFFEAELAKKAPRRAKDAERKRRKPAENSGTVRNDAEENGNAPTQADRERALFDRGKEVCGKNAGGLLTTLLKSNGYDVEKARALIELAATKSDPREFIAAATRKGNGQQPNIMDIFDRRIAATEGGAVEGDPPMRDITPRGVQSG